MTNQNTDNNAEAGASTTTTSEALSELDQLKAQLAKANEEITQEKNKYLYLYAEFDTHKKRTIKERSDLLKFGHENFSRDLCLVKDNLERALQYTSNTDALLAGLNMVNDEMKRSFERFGVTEVKTIGEKFDPTLHEAVGQEPSDQDGIIVKEHLKGYLIHGRLLRPAKVIIGIKK